MCSAVWNHFTVSIADENKAICNHCKSLMLQGGKNLKTYGMTNLLKYLRLKHEAEYSALQAAKEVTQTKSKGKSVGVQQILNGFVQKVIPFGFNHPMAWKIIQYVAEMIALDNKPFSIVDDDGFKRLLEVLEPRYTLPRSGHPRFIP